MTPDQSPDTGRGIEKSGEPDRGVKVPARNQYSRRLLWLKLTQIALPPRHRARENRCRRPCQAGRPCLSIASL